jgi:hypothetical protein
MSPKALRPRQRPPSGVVWRSGPVNMALRPRQQKMKTFPESDNPLTLALIQSTRAKTHEDMVQAARLIRALEFKLTGCEVDRCRLAAEVLIERKLA